MIATDRRVLFCTRPRCSGLAGVTACAVLCGCASMHTHNVNPDAPKLPPAVVERLPQTAAVYFSEAFRAAHPVHGVSLLGDTQTWHHALGSASVETFRQALEAVYSNVVELPEVPDALAMPPGVSVVFVPEPPTVKGVVNATAVVTTYRQNVEYPMSWRVAGSELPTHATVEGIVATGAHGVGFMFQKKLDEWMIRSAGAALIVLFRQVSAVDATDPAAHFDAAESPNANGVGILRLDAGLAHDDGIERRIAACISHAVSLPATLTGEQPGAALRDALFPWFDPGVAPNDADGVRRLLERPRMRARLAALGVGKLVLFTARDVDAREKRNMYCAAGFNAGACFGLYESQTGYAVDVTVWDVERREPLATDRTKFLHKLGAVGILIPIPFFASNETEACEQMQRYVHRTLQQ